MTSSNNLVENDRSLIAGKTPRRVKVYLLRGEDWLDNGTGYCIGEIEPETNKPYFIVRNELNAEDVILKSFLEGSIQYQRQQETLIVWTDLSGKDLALSFQETEGCADLCEFIIRVQQGNYSPDISLYYVIPNLSEGDDITELITGPITCPEDPTLDNLESTLDIINQGSNSQYTRTYMSNFIIERQYLLKLIDVFYKAEEMKSLTNLYSLSEIVKTLILYNESSLIEDFLSTEEKLLGLVGILEYDPEYPKFKACHRDFLESKSFKTVIPIDNLNIFKKDFHLNFLKDVVLARFLDDQTFNLISSLIYVNQVELINYLKNPDLLEKLFNIYDGNEIELKRNGVKMLHQYVLIAKSLQSYQKSKFFSVLVKSGLFNMIRFALNDLDSTTRVLGTELVVVIIEQDVSLVNSIDNEEGIDISDPPNNPIIDKDETLIEPRNLKLKLSDDMTLILILTKLLIEDKNPGLKVQAFEALRTLLDSNIATNSIPSNNDFETDQSHNDFNPLDHSSEEFNDINTNNYFKAFYSQVAPDLFKNLIELSQSDDIKTINKIKNDELLYQRLCEIISFCSKEHEVHISRPFFLEHNILLGVARLIDINCKLTLKLSAIRCLKNIILLNDNFYCRYIISNNILSYFFKFFESVVNENNLANSACLDLIEIILKNCDSNVSIKRQNFKLLVNYIYKNFKEFCQSKINYVNTGIALINLVENGFYDNATNNSTKNETSFESDDALLTKCNVSTPIKADDELNNTYFNGIAVHQGISSPAKPTNLFENIEKDLSNNSNTEKRHRDEDEELDDASKIQVDKPQLVNNEGINKTKLSTSLKNRFSSASKKIALSLHSPNVNGTTNNATSNV